MKMPFGTSVNKVLDLGETFQIHVEGFIPFEVEKAQDFDIATAQGVEIVLDATKMSGMSPTASASIEACDVDAGATFYKNNAVIGNAAFKL